MKYTISSLYLEAPDTAGDVFKDALISGLQHRSNTSAVPIFFRADDIGVLSGQFTRMTELFTRYDIPLCLAVVPTWITRQRWDAMGTVCERSSKLWCWHQHGWQHQNHEKTGKKCEFGQSRATDVIKLDIIRGRDRLKKILGHAFMPYFTPPWNRCSAATLNLLAESGFKGVSRDRGTPQIQPSALPDFQVNVDLHTRNEPDGSAALKALGEELRTAAQSGRIGIMIHHQRMNPAAFTLLENLLKIVTDHPQLVPVHFNKLI